MTSVLAAAGFLSHITIGFITWDEAWFLQVASRVANGEVLYRDVFFGTPPLSIYPLAIAVKVFGVKDLILKAYLSILFALSGLAAFLIIDQLKLGKGASIRLTLAMVAFSSPWVAGYGAAYGPTSALLAAFCLYFLLKWEAVSSSSRDSKFLLMAGALAGLAFSAKQTLGAYTAVAIFAVICLCMGTPSLKIGAWMRTVIRASLLAGGAFCTAVCLILLPVILSGGWEKFIEYGFTNKSTYLSVAGTPYFEDFYHQLRVFFTQPSDLSLRRVLYQASLFLPIAALVIWILTMLARRGRIDRPGVILGIFTGCVGLDIFPRTSIVHTSFMVPLMWVVIEWSAQSMPLMNGAFRRVVKIFTTRYLALYAATMILLSLQTFLNPDYHWSPLPHFARILLSSKSYSSEVMLGQVQLLKQKISGEPLYFQSPQAAFLYLISDLPNLTSFDFPLLTAYGLRGQMEVAEMIETGKIRWVCLTPLPVDYALRPTYIEEYIQTRMVKQPDINYLCDLYHR